MAQGNETKLGKKDMERLEKDRKKNHEPVEELPARSSGAALLRAIGVLIAIAYFVLLIFGRLFLPADGTFLNSLNVFSGAEAPNRLVRIISLSVLTLSISGILRFFIGRMANNKSLTKRTGVAVIELLGNLVKYVAILALVFFVLSALGVDTTGLLASLGILGLILGLGVTSLIEDIVAGIFIIAEHLFDVGDIVVVDGFRGTVESIGIRSTQFRDVGSDVLIMRNSSIGSLVNLTRNASGAAITIPLAPEENLERVERIIESAHLESIKEKYPIIDGGPFYLGPCEVTPRGVKNLLFVAGCKEEVKYDVQRIQYREVIELFERNGIKIGAPDLING